MIAKITRLAFLVSALVFAATTSAADLSAGAGDSGQYQSTQAGSADDASITKAVSLGFNCGLTQCLCKGFEACLELAKTGLCARKSCVGDTCTCERDLP